MCLVCGAVGDTTAATNAVFTTLVAVSPVLAIFAYKVYSLVAISQQARRRHSHWRLGALLAAYNLVVLLAVAAVLLVIIQYFGWWPYSFFGLAILQLLFWSWLAQAVVKARGRSTVMEAFVIAGLSATPFVLTLSFSSWIIGHRVLVAANPAAYSLFLFYGVQYMLFACLLCITVTTSWLRFGGKQPQARR